jgi:rod shape determining protein RodA
MRLMVSRPVGSVAARPQSTKRQRLRHLDLTLVAATLSVAVIGVVAVFSATRMRLRAAGVDQYSFLQHQVIWVVLGSIVAATVFFIDYHRLVDLAAAGYVAVLLALLAVMSPIGSAAKGSQRWFALGPLQLQPSTFASVIMIVMLAGFCNHREQHLPGRQVITILVCVAIPMGLIALQPDLGTAIVVAVITFAMLSIAGVRGRHATVLGLGAILGIIAITSFGILKTYQVHRLTAFVNQSGDVRGITYNVDQSKTTIGSGGLLGKGLFRGPQTNLAYVPEQQTDFIFTAVGEQLGLAGSATLLTLFAVMAWRIYRAAQVARDQLGTLICVGVLALIGFQVFENVGMTMGIMPVTGIPLPLVSYGGSATVTTIAAIGLVLNVSTRRFE